MVNPGKQINNEDDEIGLPIKANDPDGDPLTFQATGLPAGLWIDPNTGWIKGQLDDADSLNSPYTVTVTASDGQGENASQTFNWLFVAPQLTANVVATSPTEGIQFSGTVATLSNANVGSAEDGLDYIATIDWGDHTSLDTGTVVGTRGSYTVQGSHVYTEIGSFSVNVTITDESLAFKKVTGTATVVEASVSATGIPVSVLGSGSSIPVATFTDLNTSDTSYTATINWGDNTPNTSGTIKGSNGKFIVYGDHSYGSHGTFSIGVTMKDGGVIVATTSSTATVGDVWEGRESNLVVDFFTDDDSYDQPSDYTAAIDWGDQGRTPHATVTRVSNAFEISANHVYASPGAYTVSVTVNDPGGSALPARTTTVYVAEQPLTVYTAPIYATAGQTLSNQIVALITDPDPRGPSNGATIDWGDGSASSNGSVSSAAGLLTISGAHNYAEVGGFAVSVSFSPGTGLVVPVILSAITSQDTASSVAPKNGEQDLVGGKLKWSIKATNPRNSNVVADLTFVPSKDNKGTRIVFLQVIVKRTLGDEAYFGKKDAEFYRQFSVSGQTLGDRLDFIKGESDPYDNAQWNGTDWIREEKDNTQIGDGTTRPPTNATTRDRPGFDDTPNTPGDARNGKVATMILETAVFCIDSQEVLGALTWGFKVPANQNDAIEITGGRKNDAQRFVDGFFQDLIQKANQRGKGDAKNPLPMQHAQLKGEPFITKPKQNLVGGSSAVPDK
jgi:hypothetical protein